jgi:hypothetical protein
VDQRNPKNRTQNVSRETFGWLAIVTWGAGHQESKTANMSLLLMGFDCAVASVAKQSQRRIIGNVEKRSPRFSQLRRTKGGVGYL